MLRRSEAVLLSHRVTPRGLTPLNTEQIDAEDAEFAEGAETSAPHGGLDANPKGLLVLRLEKRGAPRRQLDPESGSPRSRRAVSALLRASQF